MTKKRFIKLLMSHGEQINQARSIAFHYNAQRKPYAKAYSDYMFKYVARKFNSLGVACAKVSESILAMGQVIKNFVATLSSSETAGDDDGR